MNIGILIGAGVLTFILIFMLTTNDTTPGIKKTNKKRSDRKSTLKKK
jgi:hypothetical protein